MVCNDLIGVHVRRRPRTALNDVRFNCSSSSPAILLRRHDSYRAGQVLDWCAQPPVSLLLEREPSPDWTLEAVQ